IYYDQPVNKSSFIETNTFPVPVLMFSNIPYKSYLNCYFTYNANNTREDNNACSQYIRQPILNNSTSKYDGNFLTNGNLLFSTNPNDDLKDFGIMDIHVCETNIDDITMYY
ncbi:4923_t:CDS:2, partial [Scutellospora calospora]